VPTSTKTTTQISTRLPKIEPGSRLAVLGIGSELRSDDAAGVMIARRLSARLPERDNLLILDTGAVPESFTGPVRRFKPDFVLLIDAADLGLDPGSIEVLPWHAAGGFSAATHALPVSVLAEYLNQQLGCQVYLLGIQPASLNFLEKMTPSGKQAVRAVVSAIIRWLKPSVQ
jgi:hydrogenase maturation protease HycI